MKSVVLHSVLFLCALLACHFACAQDQHFSQFYTAPLMQNPALAGSLYDMQANINYKRQWGTVAEPFSTSSASFDMKLPAKKRLKNNLGVGLSFFNDNAGLSKLRADAVHFSFAYHIKLSANGSLSGGLQGGLVQRSIDPGKLQWGSQYNGNYYDPNLPSNELTGINTKLYVDAAIGIAYAYNNRSIGSKVSSNNFVRWTLGLSAFHVNRPDISFTQSIDPLHIKWAAHGQGLFSVGNSNLAVAPGFVLYNQGAALEIYYGTLLRYGIKQQSRYTGFVKGSAFSVGFFHRWVDALVFVFQYEFSDYRFGISYDVNHSDLYSATQGLGGFEISASYMVSKSSSGRMRR